MARRILLAMPLLGGGAEVFVELAAGLNRRGLEVDVLAPTFTRAHHLDAGVRLRYYQVPPYEGAAPDAEYLAFQIGWGLGALRELRAIELEYDAVVAHLPWGVAKLYAHRRRRPLVGIVDVCWTDCHQVFEDVAPAVATPKHVDWELGKFLQEDTMRACDRLVAPSAFFRDHHAAKGLAIDVIRHGRDAARYAPQGDRAAGKARAGVPPGKKLVLGVGFDFAHKGHHLTAEVATRVKDDDVHFLILGPDPALFDWWYENDPSLRGRLEVRPNVPHQDAPAIYACADIFVFPSLFETFGLSPLEAMAAGVPVIGHRAASIPELVRDGVEGYLVPPSDVDAYEARVRELLRDEEKRRSMGEAGRARFLTEFTEERMVSEWERLLRALPEARRG